MKRRVVVAELLAAPAVLPRPAWAPNAVKVAVGQRGAGDTSPCAFGERLGFVRDAGMALELLYTGGVECGVGAGMLAILGAAARNGPVRILSSNFRGASDTFWYAKAGSGIRSFKDAGGRSVAHSTTGSSSNLVSTRRLLQTGVTTAHGVQTGDPVTEVMSGRAGNGGAVGPAAAPRPAGATGVRAVGGRPGRGAAAGGGVRVHLPGGERGGAAAHAAAGRADLLTPGEIDQARAMLLSDLPQNRTWHYRVSRPGFAGL